MAFMFGDRLGRKNAILLGTSIMSIGTILMSTSFSLPQMFVGRIILGYGKESHARVLVDILQLTYRDFQHRKRHQYVVCSHLADRDRTSQMARKVGHAGIGYEHFWPCPGQLDQLRPVVPWRLGGMAVPPRLPVWLYHTSFCNRAVAPRIPKVRFVLFCLPPCGCLTTDVTCLDGFWAINMKLKPWKSYPA